MQSWYFVGLLKIEFPTRTVRLCDGGYFVWGAETYRASDAVFGTIGSIEELTEGVGDEVPALELVLNPPIETAPASLVQPGFQNSRVRLWLARYDPASMTVISAGSAMFDGFLDTATLVRGPGKLELRCQVVAMLERLFELNIGNSLNQTFHKSIWPGETGEDQATGLSLPDAWGVEGPVQATTYYSGGGGAETWAGRGTIRLA